MRGGWLIFAGAAVVATVVPWLARRGEAHPAPLQAVVPAATQVDGAPAGGPLAVTAAQAWVHAEPSSASRRLGYLSAGAVVPRGSRFGDRGCPGGWYGIEPRGFVCAGPEATLDPEHPVVTLSARPRDAAPTVYVTSRYPPPPLYGRFPSRQEQRQHEPELDDWLERYDEIRKKPGFVAPPPPERIPAALADGERLPRLGDDDRGRGLKIGTARVRSSFALLASYEHDGRHFGLTTELALIPLDRTRVRAPTRLRGADLREHALPIAVVVLEDAKRYRLTDDRLKRDGSFERWTIVDLASPKPQRRGYLEGKDGRWMRARDAVVIDGFRRAPGWAEEGKKWIDVSILDQSLVAYEGTRPVFATVVSTGADGLASPRTSHATKRGTFLIHTKHVSHEMSDPSEGGYDLAAVPYVQYFHEGYALHGAYWHDDFGKPRSHGCINLSPADAAWLFAWTDPGVPAGWHGALSPDEGTLVHVHP